jgi:hypothetical protein
MSTIWEFPIDGAPLQKFFSNPPDNIVWASFSKDGTEMAIVQGRTTTNLVIFTRAG